MLGAEGVWVVVLTYNRSDLLDACLRNLVPRCPPGVRFLVVDNGSQEDIAASVRSSFEEVRVLRITPNRGFAGGVNAGVTEARRLGARIAVVLPNDNRVEDGWLETLLGAFRPGVAAVMSDSVNEDLDLRLRDYDGTLNLAGRNVMIPTDRNRSGAPTLFYSSGNGVALRLTLVDVPYDPTYWAYYEDVEQGWRLRLQGHEIAHAPGARLRHAGGDWFRRFPFERVFLAERNRLRTILSHFGRNTLARLLPYLAIDTLIGWLHPKKALARVTAVAWILANFPMVLRKRTRIQALRRVPDEQILAHMTCHVAHPFLPGAGLANGLARLYAGLAGLKTGF